MRTVNVIEAIYFAALEKKVAAERSQESGVRGQESGTRSQGAGSTLIDS